MSITKKLVVTKMGISGYLSPHGKFTQCETFDHIRFAEIVYAIELIANPSSKRERRIGESLKNFLHRLGYITLSSKGRGYTSVSHVNFPQQGIEYADDKASFVSKAQVDWFVENRDNLDEVQEDYVNEYLQLYINEDDVEVKELVRKNFKSI